MNCGHQFCRTCWQNYLHGKIVDEGLNHSIQCPHPECGFHVDDENILVLVDDQKVLQKYQHSMTNDFVLVIASHSFKNRFIGFLTLWCFFSMINLCVGVHQLTALTQSKRSGH